MSRKLLVFACASLLGACSADRDVDVLSQNAKAPQEEEAVIEARALSEEDAQKLQDLYEQQQAGKQRLRSAYHLRWSEGEISRIASNVLNTNIYNLEGKYYIIGKKANGKTYGLVSRNNGAIEVAENLFGKEFSIRAYPRTSGVPYRIFQERSVTEYLRAGFLIKDAKRSVPFLSDKNPNDFGTAWDIKLRGKGLVLENEMPYTRNDEEPTLGNIERRVLSFSEQYQQIVLASPKDGDVLQEFAIRPKGIFRVLGIRYFVDERKFSEAIYDQDLAHRLGHNIELQSKISEFESDEYSLSLQIHKLSDIKVERTYVNETDREVSYDMFFDQEVNQFSLFKEALGLSIKAHQQYMFPLPSIVKDNLWFLPDDVRTAHSQYRKDRISRQLKGVLYLLIRPRAKAHVEYTYSVYRVKLPYMVFLSSVEDRSKIVRVVGIWEGDIYTEQDADRHRFRSTSIASNEQEEEIIDFDLSNEELEEQGYRSSEGASLRSGFMVKKRIRL